MTYETLLYETCDRMATITLNRPERRNTAKPFLPLELQDAIARANQDPNIRVIVLRCEGREFVCVAKDKPHSVP